MFTGLSTVATRRTPPRLGVPWPKATRGMGTPSAPRPAPAVMLAAPAIHWRRDSLPLLSLSSRACFIARPPRPTIQTAASPRMASQIIRARDSLVDLPVLNHEAHTLERRHVLQRIALHRDQIRSLTGLDRSHLSVDPTRLGPPAGAGEEAITRRHAEPHERLQLEGHEPVHAVGATGEADARGEMAGEILVHHPT